MNKSIFLDLATETLRKYGEIPSGFAEKMAKRIRRKFGVKVESDKIIELAFHYKAIYSFGKSILKDYLSPPKGNYASTEDVDTEKFLASLAKKYPDESLDVLQTVVGYVIYYEYLR
ncbi:MAG: hypothetical protein Q8L64_02465 [bacterium]|nr:hypothetical protein [bacterium]